MRREKIKRFPSRISSHFRAPKRQHTHRNRIDMRRKMAKAERGCRWQDMVDYIHNNSPRRSLIILLLQNKFFFLRFYLASSPCMNVGNMAENNYITSRYNFWLCNQPNHPAFPPRFSASIFLGIHSFALELLLYTSFSTESLLFPRLSLFVHKKRQSSIVHEASSSSLWRKFPPEGCCVFFFCFFFFGEGGRSVLFFRLYFEFSSLHCELSHTHTDIHTPSQHLPSHPTKTESYESKLK